MAMQTDVKAGAISATGAIFDGPTRVKGMLIIPGTSAGLITIRDGGGSGTVVFTIATLAGGTPFSVVIPGEGVRFDTNVYAAISNVTGTVFYG
jgi:hypothetical protein